MKITVIVVRPLAAPAVETIEDSVEAIGAIVGGYFEVVRLTQNVDLYCNEEGRRLELPGNRLVEGVVKILGAFLIARRNDEGDTLGLGPDDLAEWLARVASWPMIVELRRPGAGAPQR